MFRSKTPKLLNNKRKKLEGSIAELIDIPLNQTKQSVMIRGTDTHHPILLFLHGGPGLAQIGFIRRFQTELEKHFIVVNWDQRGAGKSYSPHLSPESMTIEQLIEDTHELIQYILNRFHQKKLFLVGHSWGSIIGAFVAQRYPELIHAYIGIGQLSDVERNDLITYQLVLIHARQYEKKFAIKKLNRIGYPPYQNIQKINILRHFVSKFGGEFRNGSLKRILSKSTFGPEYTLADWRRFKKGTRFTLQHLGPEIMKINLFEHVDTLEIPVYFCVGRYDTLSSVELQENYFEFLTAPHKDIIWFENSAHFPHLEEPNAFLVTCLRVKEEVLIPNQKTASIKGAL